MHIDIELLFYHSMLALLPSYFLIAFYKEQFFWKLQYGPVSKYVGKRAKLLSLLGFGLLIFFAIPMLAKAEWFEMSYLIAGVPIGFLFALGVHAVLERSGKKRSWWLKIVPENVRPKKVTPVRYAFFSVPGVGVGVVLGLILYVLEGGTPLAIASGSAVAVLVTWLLARTHWM